MSRRVTVFISAENPNYVKLSPEENMRRMASLYSYLRSLRLKRIYPSKFIDTSSGYTEHSYLVRDIPLDSAIQLARYFGQQSILIDGLGILDVNTMMLAPQIKKYTGAAARRRSAYSIVNGRWYVSYDFDFEHQVLFIP